MPSGSPSIFLATFPPPAHPVRLSEAEMTSKEFLRLRKKLLLSQQELAELTGVDTNTIARHENAAAVGVTPHFARLLKLIEHMMLTERYTYDDLLTLFKAWEV